MAEQPLFTNEPRTVSLAQESQYAPNGIVSRTLFRANGTRQVLFGFAEGQELTEHTSPHHALVQIVSGQCEFFLKGEPRTLKAGDLLYMPPGLPHAVQAKEKFSMLLTLVSTETPAALPQTPIKEDPDIMSSNLSEIPIKKIFDVREIPCSIKHGQIFERWRNLAVGDYFVLKNDHDPVPLRYQFEFEFKGAYGWDYLESGPEVFQVKISKLSDAPATILPTNAKSCGCSD